MYTIKKPVDQNASTGYWITSSSFAATPTDRFNAGSYDAANAGYGAVARFVDIPIPKNAIIESAYLDGTCSTAFSGTDQRSFLSGVDTSSCPAFTGYSYAAFQALPDTDASVNWNSTTPWVAGTVYTSPNIAPVIQEIVDRADWTSGSNIGIQWFNNGSPTGANNLRRMAHFTHATYGPPSLTISYSLPSFISMNFIGDYSKIYIEGDTTTGHIAGYDTLTVPHVLTKPRTGTRMAIVCTGTEGSDATVTGVTYDGTPMVSAVYKGYFTPTANSTSGIWVLKDSSLPDATGTYNVVVATTNPFLNTNIALTAYLMNQIDQDATILGGFAYSDSTSTLDVSLTPIRRGSWGITTCLCGNVGTYSSPFPQVEKYEVQNGETATFSGSISPFLNTVDTTFSHTYTGALNRHTMAAIIIAPKI